jgi:hypothetical protein
VSAAEAVGGGGVEAVAALARHADAVACGEDVSEHVVSQAVDEAIGRMHVGQRPGRQRVGRERHVLGPEEAPQVGEREHFARDGDELAVTDAEGGGRGLKLVAWRARRDLRVAVVGEQRPRAEYPEQAAEPEEQVRHGQTDRRARTVDHVGARALGGVQRLRDRGGDLFAQGLRLLEVARGHARAIGLEQCPAPRRVALDDKALGGA